LTAALRAVPGLIRLCALLVLAGCAPALQLSPTMATARLPRAAELAGVPFFPQERYACGPASLAMVLAWSGLAVGPDDLMPQAYTPGREGTLRTDVLSAARRHGRLAVRVGTRPDLLAELAAGHPVLVFQNLGLRWIPQWHFAVAIGYDLDAGTLVLHSGTRARYVTPLWTFERTWARADQWAVVILPPGRLPATADERGVIQAASGLERAGRHGEAATAYLALLQRWPRSYPGFVGLGNARYRLGDYAGAEDAFRGAIRLRPDDPAAWNNLAHALVGQQRRDDAIAAAAEALRLARDDVETYRATLTEVSR
jgi:hypothetical protein